MPDKYLNREQVAAFAGITINTIYVLMREEKFPANFKINCDRVMWVKEEVEEWLRQRADANRFVKRTRNKKQL